MNFEIVSVIFERIYGLVPVRGKDIASVASEALIYLQKKGLSVRVVV
jgi:hypothetical protein